MLEKIIEDLDFLVLDFEEGFWPFFQGKKLLKFWAKRGSFTRSFGRNLLKGCKRLLYTIYRRFSSFLLLR